MDIERTSHYLGPEPIRLQRLEPVVLPNPVNIAREVEATLSERTRAARDRLSAEHEQRQVVADMIVNLIGDDLGTITVNSLIEGLIIILPDMPLYLFSSVIHENLSGVYITILPDGRIVAPSESE
jgi:hypothetical protein